MKKQFWMRNSQKKRGYPGDFEFIGLQDMSFNNMINDYLAKIVNWLENNNINHSQPQNRRVHNERY